MQIVLQEIYKYFDPKKPAVRDINLTIPSGKLTTFLGPSGCGKTTTMLMIAGLEKPSNGEIFFGDRNVKNVSPKLRNIGMVFQNSALYPSMTVEENIAFPLQNIKLSKNEIEPKVKKVLELVNMQGYENRKPHQLSGGQRQRVAIARALVKEPDLLILDEPLSALDASLRMKLREEIRKIQQQLGITTIMVTHDQEEAISMSDYIAVMKDGTLQQFSTASTIIQNPENWFVASFMGMPYMNRLECQYDYSSHSLVLSDYQKLLSFDTARINPEKLKPKNRLIVGFRPHHADLYIEEPLDVLSLKGKVLYAEHTGRELMVTVELNDREKTTCKILCEEHLPICENLDVWIAIKNDQFIFESEGKQQNLQLTSFERKIGEVCGV